MHLNMNFNVRKNLDGEYVTIHANQLSEGVEYAVKTGVTQVQIRGILGSNDVGMAIDFSEFEKLSERVKVISFTDKLDNVINIGSFYSLQKIEKIFFQKKQTFNIDISLFPALHYFGCEYWKGLTNISSARSLESLIIYKFNDSNLDVFAGLDKLETLHIYDSKVSSLLGIETLPIKELSLVKDNSLEEIDVINKISSLKKLHIEKCKNITDFSFLTNNESIEDLFLSDVDSFYFIPGMKKLKSLKFWNAEDGNLNFLLQSPTLKTVDFHPHKKNYTHKKEEINILINS
jgi:hypothetical protein